MIKLFHLKQDIDQDDEDRVGEVEEEPELHRFDGGGAGKAGGDRNVEGGQHYQTGSGKKRDKNRTDDGVAHMLMV